MIRCFNCQRKVEASARVCRFCGRNPWDAEHTDDMAVNNGILYKYNGADTEVDIPEGVTVIEESAFESTLVTGIVFPEGVRVIKRYAFCACKRLLFVSLPSSLERIEEGAFVECPRLRMLHIPSECEVDNGAIDTGTEIVRY